MNNSIGIRREDKNIWERRVPLIPADAKELIGKFGVRIVVQPSDNRAFTDDSYRDAGCDIQEDINTADLIIAVKEIPESLLRPDKTYVYFSHTIKGQPYNMSMLRRLMELKCNLIDYERIVDEKNRRLIFFGRYAGYAGMIETLHAFGEKLKRQGISNPFEAVKQAYEYNSVEDAKEHIREIGRSITDQGLASPGVFGFAGYGNVSQAAQEIFDLLPHKVITPAELKTVDEQASADNYFLYKVVFKEADMVKPTEGEFLLQDYYDHPEKYVSKFEEYLPHLTVLVNCIYWTEAYPRLITMEYLRKNPSLPLAVIGDISVDIDGSIEATYKATYPDMACYTFNPTTLEYKDAILPDGLTIMAIDNLPCEFPKESSAAFSHVLKKLLPEIIKADFQLPTKELELPFSIKKALILHRGELTADYHYMKQYLTTENK
ncbi:MAG: hypothetical protein GXO91_04620 [FCB group bacterium]|nr:hypothetical protein [FCB group bacterium]